MDLINKFISENSGDLIGKLTSSGFDLDQAKQFLPEAASGLTEAAGKLDMNELMSGISSGDTSKLMSMVNIEAMASKLGMDASMVTTGLSSLLPSIVSAFTSGGGLGGAVSALSGGSAGGLLNSVKGLFGK